MNNNEEQIIEKYHKNRSTRDISFMFGVVLTKNFLINSIIIPNQLALFSGIFGIIGAYLLTLNNY